MSDLETMLNDLVRAMTCLQLEVHEDVARDVKDNVYAVVSELISDKGTYDLWMRIVAKDLRESQLRLDQAPSQPPAQEEPGIL